MATFASDGGPNLIAYILLFSACAIVPVVLFCIFRAQHRRSLRWAWYGLAVPFIPLGLLISMALVGQIIGAIFRGLFG
jgi:hypothetical protein